MPNPDINLVYHLYSLPKDELIKEFANAQKVIEYTKFIYFTNYCDTWQVSQTVARWEQSPRPKTRII